MKKILHLSTGGTITGYELDYPPLEKLSKIFTDAVDVRVYLMESMKIHAEYDLRVVCNKDSREISESDRKILVQEIERAYRERGIKDFLVTHGTFTMPDTGAFLLENLNKDILFDISVVITGAMYPMNLVGGDGLLNIGASVSILINTEKPLGVVINMHGKNWDPRKIKKNKESLIFEEVA